VSSGEPGVGLRGGTPTVQEVGDGLFAYVQPDGSWMVNNTGFLVGPDGVTSVDTCSTELRTRTYLEAVAAVTPLPVRTLVNTHHHPDHTTGNGLLPGATIVAHEDARAEMLAMAELERKGLSLDFIWEEFDAGDVPLAPPFLTFRDEVALWVGDRRCELRHVGGPAHTTNDVVVWVPDQSVLYAGDLLFNGGTPFLLSGSVAGAVRVLEDVVAPLGARTIVPGHGPVCGPEVVDEVLGYLRFVLDVAARAREAGAGPLEAARETDLGRYAGWTDRERIVGNLHRAMAELDGTPPGGPVDAPTALREMVAYNGGRPLTCLA
jgi:cyclase